MSKENSHPLLLLHSSFFILLSWTLPAHFSFELGWTLSAHFPFEMGWTLLAHFSFEMGWTLQEYFFIRNVLDFTSTFFIRNRLSATSTLFQSGLDSSDFSFLFQAQETQGGTRRTQLGNILRRTTKYLVLFSFPSLNIKQNRLAVAARS